MVAAAFMDMRGPGITLTRFEALQLPLGFPNPVSTAVCLCTVLGPSRVSGDADFRLDSSESRTWEDVFFISLFVPPFQNDPIRLRPILKPHSSQGALLHADS